MGVRLAKNLKKSDYQVSHVEVSEVGQQRLRDEVGVDCVSIDAALDNVDVVILAVPDTLIGKIAAEISPKLRAGVMVMTLDAAAPFAGHLPERPDLVYFVAHPCHPPIFNDETTPEGRRDSSAAAPPAIHHQRPDAGSGVGLRPGRGCGQGDLPAHPAQLSPDGGTDGNPGAGPVRDRLRHAALRDEAGHGRDRAPRRAGRGGPRFPAGAYEHPGRGDLQGNPGAFSDACNKAIQNGLPRLLRDDWLKVFEHDEIAESIRRIT
jgi:hypothetical protein